MPIYEYECRACGHSMDRLQKISEAPLTDCPQCGESQLRKLVSAPRFRLKGGGWYETDFKGGNKRNLADGDAGDRAGKEAGKSGAGAGEASSGGESGSAKAAGAGDKAAAGGAGKSTGSGESAS